MDIIENHSFQVNGKKISYQDLKVRQEITGLTVNEFPNIKRSYVKDISGALHAWAKWGYQKASDFYLKYFLGIKGKGYDLKNVIKGKIAFLRMVKGEHDPVYRKTALRFNQLSNNKIKLKDLCKIEQFPLYGGSPKEPWKHWFNCYRDSIAFLEIEKNEICSQATAFFIGKNTFATAGHNLVEGNMNIYLGDSSLTLNFKRYKAEPMGVDIGCFKTIENVAKKWLPYQFRLPETGEEIAAIGYPRLPTRHSALVLHVGVVESVPVNFKEDTRFIQVSFQSGGGLSGAPLIDKRGYVIGIMTENIFMGYDNQSPQRPYGQAVPIEYFSREFFEETL